MNITLHSRLALVPHKVRRDQKNYIVEDLESGEFFEMPEVCIAAIDLLEKGLQLEDVERNLILKFPDEDVNLLSFAEQLYEMDLLAEIDGVVVEKPEVKKLSKGFLSVSPKLGSVFFNRFSYLIYMSLFCLNIILFIIYPSSLIPHYKDIFVFEYMFLNILLWMFLTFILVLIHELGHILAMRAHNLPTRLEIGHRLFLVVLETDMSSVWKLSSKNRNQLFLAGLCFDTVILTIGLLTKIIFANESVLLTGIITLAILDISLRMIYQCCVYMKTDLYYVLENMTGCYNLMENANQFIKITLSRTDSSKNEEVVFDGEKRPIMIYTLFYIAGVVLTMGMFITFYLPQVLYAIHQILPGFQAAPTSYAFWDAVIFSMQIIVVTLLLLNSWRKKYRL